MQKSQRKVFKGVSDVCRDRWSSFAKLVANRSSTSVSVKCRIALHAVPCPARPVRCLELALATVGFAERAPGPPLDRSSGRSPSNPSHQPTTLVCACPMTHAPRGSRQPEAAIFLFPVRTLFLLLPISSTGSQTSSAFPTRSPSLPHNGKPRFFWYAFSAFLLQLVSTLCAPRSGPDHCGSKPSLAADPSRCIIWGHQ
ncbi:hypothetical protein VTI74DRAFT_4463 [Chaetomium olivicolor]